ncbi:MAG: hypothetical protein EOP93_22200, partial [Lysobacteraceae bacterium]
MKCGSTPHPARPLTRPSASLLALLFLLAGAVEARGIGTAGDGGRKGGDAPPVVAKACATCPDPDEDPPQAPVVVLTAPGNGQAFAAGAPVLLSATAYDPDGSVAQVQFLVDGASIGSDASAPYGTTWIATPGSHT